MITRMPGVSFTGALPALSPEVIELGDKLRAHVEMLGGTIGERNVWHPEALDAAVAYVREQLSGAGYEVGEQPYQVEGRTVLNLDASLPGSALADEIVLVGAHYDSLRGSPGANDNATGIAAVLEIAHTLRDRKVPRTLRFVAFVNEEPPFFQTNQMGSRVYARRCQERGEKIVAMLAPETIGYYSDEKGSQRYPFPFNLFYPDTGNFIGFIGNYDSRRLVSRCVESFRRHAQFPSEGAAVPGLFEGVGWSDHWSFWQEGYAGLMVTDTAPFRYRHYHTQEDTPDRVNYDRMSRVVAGLVRVVEDLTERE